MSPDCRDHGKEFIRYYDSFAAQLRSLVLQEKNANKALSIAGAYGEIRAFNHDGVYADVEVERHVVSRVMATGCVDCQSLSEARGEGVMVVATDMYDYGGHSKVLLTWLRLMKDELPHKLVITRALTDCTQKNVIDMGVGLVQISDRGMDAVLAVLRAAKGCSRVVLMIHPQDIVSSVAARILAASGYQVIFYNHADHLFSYGIGAAHVVCEISAYGESINRRTKRVQGVSVRLGVPLKSVALTDTPLLEQGALLDGGKVILSVGSSYKYKPDESFIFADFIDGILACRSDVKVLLVGPTGQESWWKERRESWDGRVLFYGTLPQSEYMKLLNLADVYIDSYPVTGGTAFPEALLAGKACAGLITPVQGYTLADKLKVDAAESLVLKVEKILDHDPVALQEIDNVREEVIAEQNEEVFKSRILDIYGGDVQGREEQDAASNNGMDTRWLEDKWRKGGCLTAPRRRTIAALPIRSVLWLTWYFWRLKLAGYR